MIVLAGYAIILQLCSFFVLHVRYEWFRGIITPTSAKLAQSHQSTICGVTISNKLLYVLGFGCFLALIAVVVLIVYFVK